MFVGVVYRAGDLEKVPTLRLSVRGGVKAAASHRFLEGEVAI